MQPFSKYVFYGGTVGVALVVAVLANIGGADAQTVSFLAQSDTSARTSMAIRNYQQLLCSDIEYDIATVDLGLSGGSMISSQKITVSFGKLSGSGAWDKLKKRTVAQSEEVTFTSGDLATVQFVFNPPLARDELCSDPDEMVFMYAETSESGEAAANIHGSRNPDAYRSSLYGCVLETGLPCLHDVRDIAFALRTDINHPPVIIDIPSLKVNEGETVTLNLTATDPDGDNIIWSSSALEDGAILNPDTGVFTWTPSADQIGAYEIVFTATDDGGPVQEASILTLTITVLDIVTPPDTNQTLLETTLAYELDTNIENSYLANLKNVETFLEKDQVQAAISQLNAFVKKLEQDLKRELITETQYADLLQRAVKLLQDLEAAEV